MQRSLDQGARLALGGHRLDLFRIRLGRRFLGDRAGLLRVATAALAAVPIPTESRRSAIEILGRMGKHEATENALGSILRDPAVGDDAALALARIRGETFFEASWRALLAPAIPYR